jgi:para-aminobenzoate synthetase component I
MSAANPRLEGFIAELPARMAGVHHVELSLGEPFVEVVSRFADEPGTIALLSGGSLDSARYNVLGIRPWLSLREADGRVTADFAGKRLVCDLDPFDMLDAVVERYSLPGPEDIAPLSSGLLGYLSYDLKDCLEVLPRTSCDDLRLPRLLMTAPSILLIEDRQRGTTTVHAPIFDDGLPAAKRRLAQFQEELARSIPPVRLGNAQVGGLVSGLSQEEYVDAVEAIRDYIVRGHVYQVNMSQRFETPFKGDAFALFQGMFEANPAPFFAFVQAGDHQIVSTSPERFIQLADGKVETRPIKGTRKRGKTPEEDNALRHELETSTKDDAELSMIVDLLRNDIGKVCAAQSVRVTEHKRVEAYQNVYHLVSLVVGQLDEGKSAVDLIRATFPGGSITGCPKIRSMEIIDELEPVRRHIYTGSIGYVGFHGTMDLSIAIRTATITGGRLVFSVGGGCVFDSKGPDEYEETLHKGRTLMRALEHTTTPAPVVLPAHERIGFWNGKFKRISEIKVSVEDEGLSYGYGCFETLRVDHGRVLGLDAHLARFRRTWTELFAAPFPDLTWRAVIEQVVTRSELAGKLAAVKILAAGRKPGEVEPTLVVTAREYVHRLSGTGRTGLKLVVYPHHRHTHLADHKTTNYMFQRLAARWAQKQLADEAVILNGDGSVSETNTGNILCVIGGKLVRPLSEHVLPGTMEQAVCEVLAGRGMTVERRRVTVEELVKAEAVMVTNALMGAVAVATINGKAVGDRGMCTGINEVVLGETAR